MPINSVTSKALTLANANEIAVPVGAGTESVTIKAGAGNAAAGVTLGQTGVAAPGGDAYHLFPGEEISIELANPQKLFVRGAANDKLYFLGGNLS